METLLISASKIERTSEKAKLTQNFKPIKNIDS